MAWALVEKQAKGYLVLGVAVHRTFFRSVWAEDMDKTRRVRCAVTQPISVVVQLNASEDEIRPDV